MRYLLIIWLAAIIMSCSDSNEVTTTKEAHNPQSDPGITKPIDKKPETNESGCFMKVIDRDTAIVILQQKGSDITGKMVYDNFQKDGSRGTLKGKQEGDIIKLFYDFNSEGMKSVMEVYFKKVPGGLLRGMGNMDVKGDTAYFTSGINYSDKEAFSNVDCDKVKEKFQ